MENIIDHLQSLFKARLELDEQIKKAIEFDGYAKEVGKELKESKVGKAKRQYKTRKPKEKKAGKEANYNCEECDYRFSSADDYLTVRCPECKSKRLLKVY
jgi:DNA-directed RNA polymerase subunit RPC12/RpoP